MDRKICTIQLLYSTVNLSHKFYFVDTSDDRKMRKRSIKLKSKTQKTPQPPQQHQQ